MSAYMVTKIHIDRLLATVAHDPTDANRKCGRDWLRSYFYNEPHHNNNLDSIGQMLAAENLTSIHYRYPDTVGNDDNVPGPNEPYWLEPYTFPQTTKPLTCIQALKAIDCYEYQSCEHPEWLTSEAKRFCEQLRKHFVGCLPGYDRAVWGVPEN